MSEKKFMVEYCKWAEKKGYRSSETKAKSLYTNALEGIPTLPSNSPSTKMLILEAVKAVRKTEAALALILARMNELAKKLPEYGHSTVYAWCWRYHGPKVDCRNWRYQPLS